MNVVYQDSDLVVIDDVLANPDKIRQEGINAPYSDFKGMDGEIYKRVCVAELPEVRQAINRVMGDSVGFLGTAFRLNYDGEPPNNAIHVDFGWGEYAAVLYLSEPPEGVESGTAFWKHSSTGTDRIREDQLELINTIGEDWNNEEAWEQLKFVSCKYNSLIIYKSELFHSRWPFEAFGTIPDIGRLIAVVFFLEGI